MQLLPGHTLSLMAAWLAWAIAALLLAIGEVFTPGLFFLGPVALAAVAAAVAAAVGGALWLQRGARMGHTALAQRPPGD